MITALRLINFKCFEDRELAFGALTLLSGLNGTGKSSVLQALLLLRQSYDQNILPTFGLALNGDFVNLGTGFDVLFESARKEEVAFVITSSGGHQAEWRFKYDKEADVLPTESVPDYQDPFLFGDAFQYLEAERIGPRTSFEMSDYRVRHRHRLGAGGEYTAHYLALFGKNYEVDSRIAHPNATSLALQDQVEAWMSEISPGVRLKLLAHSGMDLVNLNYTFVADKQVTNPYRSTNVGFGITYTLPVLVALLSARQGSLVLLESPEAHLHPKAQAMIGELIARVCSCGAQVVFETHSDHVLNGIRIAVKKGCISPEQVRFHFFQRATGPGSDFAVQVNSPVIDRDGRIDLWPEGFFDEWDKSLEQLLESEGEG